MEQMLKKGIEPSVTFIENIEVSKKRNCFSISFDRLKVGTWSQFRVSCFKLEGWFPSWKSTGPQVLYWGVNRVKILPLLFKLNRQRLSM